MRDGVELATDVYLPDGQGPWPAVLVRLPYDKNGRYCWMPFIARPLHRARLRVPAPGRARQVPVGRRGERLRARGRRRLRHDPVDHGAALVERRRRHVGRLLLRLHPVGGGRLRAPGAEGDRAARDRGRPVRLARRRRRGTALRRSLPGPVLGGRPHAPLDAGLDATAAERAVRSRVRADRQPLPGLRPAAGGGPRTGAGGHVRRPPSVRRGSASRRCTGLAGSTTSLRRTCSTTSAS